MEISALAWLIWLRDASGCQLFSTEGKMAPPTNSELRRWIRDRAVWVNGEPLTDPHEPLWPDITNCVLFPKGRRKTTIL